MGGRLYFAANSAHPYENPTSFFSVTFANTCHIPVTYRALCFAFGLRLSGTQRQGYTLLWVMTLILLLRLA